MKLEQYISGKRKSLEKIKKELDFVENIKIPLTIEGNQLYSTEYSLAKSFEIKKRSELGGGFSGYDGGYHDTTHEYYPQFYFRVGVVPFNSDTRKVLIQHENFQKDQNIVFKKCQITSGYGDYSSENKRRDFHIDYEKTLEFFREKGVNEKIIKKLEKKIVEISDLF